jgi:hypothetical protein
MSTWATAVHEAGHALVALGCGFPLQFVTVVPTETTLGGAALGWAARPTVDEPAVPVSDLGLLLREACFAAAGPAAERIAGYAGTTGHELDAAQVRDRLWEAAHLLDMRSPVDWEGVLRATVERYLRENWSAVERIASALVSEGTVSGDRARELVGDLPALDLQRVGDALEFWAARAARARAMA